MDILGFDCQKKCESELDGLTETDEIEVVDDDNEETVDMFYHESNFQSRE